MLYYSINAMPLYKPWFENFTISSENYSTACSEALAVKAERTLKDPHEEIVFTLSLMSDGEKVRTLRSWHGFNPSDGTFSSIY